MTDEKVIEIIDTSLANEFELDIEMMVPDALLYEDLGLDSLQSGHCNIAGTGF